MSAFDAAFDAAIQQPLKPRPPEPPRGSGLRRNSSSPLRAPRPRQPEPPPPKPKKVHLVGRPNVCPCGEEIPLADDVSVWLSTPLGDCCVHTHPGACEALAPGSVREQPAKRIAERVSKEDRAERAAAEEARRRAAV